jgi:MoaA/NifB/PqqE/SkfB family radical SAM enzyme
MRVVFVVPESFSLGVEQLVASLERAGHRAWILVDPMLFEDQFLRVPPLAARLGQRERLQRRLLQLHPDLVGFSVATDLVPWFRTWLRELRRLSGVPVVAGGVHPTARPEETMATPGLDWVLRGEADHSLPLLLEHMRGQRAPAEVPGLVWRRGSEIVLEPLGEAPQDLDALPFPDKRAWRAQRYNRRYPIITSRGCPFACAYCYAPAWRALHPSHRLRRRSPEHVLAELETARGFSGVRSVSFLDDVFVTGGPWLERFAPAYAERVGLPFFAYGHATTIDAERVELLRLAGCRSLTLGYQTHSERLRRELLGRPESNEQVARAVALLKRAGIFVTLDVILGLPGQDEEELRQIARFAHEQRVDGLSVHWLRVYPDAPIAALAEEDPEPRDLRFFFQGTDHQRRLALMANLGPLLPAPLFRALEAGGHRLLPPTAGFTVNFPLSWLRGRLTGRRRLPVQNGAVGTARKLLDHSLEALSDAEPARRAAHGRLALASFLEPPKPDAVGLARARQLGSLAVQRQLLGRERLVSAVFAVTYRCPLACGHCSVRTVRSRGTLDHQACRGVLAELAALGAIKVAFFGGEPTTRRDTPELMHHAATLGLQTSLDSSGQGIDTAYAARLARSRASNVNISLDHPDEAVHDAMRGKPGAWRAARAAVGALLAQDIPVLIGTWASRGSIRDGSLVRLIELARRWGVRGVKVLHPILSGRLASAEEQRLDPRDMRALLLLAEPGFVYVEDAFALDKARSPRCSSLKKQMIYIAPDGEVQPCPGIPVSFGSLREEPLAAILERMWSHDLFRWRSSTPDTCLANDPGFRERYELHSRAGQLPVRIERLPAEGERP